MDIVALRSNRKKRYTIFQFVNMSESEREKYKNNIVCDECGGDAYYRGPSKDGKNACFGAKHIGECDSSSGNRGNNEQGEEEVNEIELQTSQFDIRWNYIRSNDDTQNTKDDEDDEVTGLNKRKYTKKPPVEKNIKISLNQILEFAELNIINEQDYSINIGENLVSLKDIVVKLEDIDDSNLNKEMFYWGKISSFKSEWLNMQYANKISILIDESIRDKFWKSYKAKILKIIKNNTIIVFGKVRKSSKGNYYIVLKDTKHFYIKKSRL
ncbi:hypothetical protein [Clostridium butyricum]|uniref:hypothetical protein n=1 Tax=Clostridium butyricum TaxID=1492 RepID=UPI00129A3B42|nr:hypothetical protein [Clostridium butyricum]QGH20234.1 hypothetical protein EBL75_00990 [Clostridium butyricum]QGH24269.1 hypothetical protein EBQ27_00990 [Clostridium butyricum]